MIKYQLQILFTHYKTISVTALILVLPFIRIVTSFDSIGREMDVCIAWAAIAMCSDSYYLERSLGTVENFYLMSKNKMKIIIMRIGVSIIFMMILSIMAFWGFLWQKQYEFFKQNTIMGHFFQSMFAFVSTLLFFSVLSMTTTNIIKNIWIGMAVNIFVWGVLVQLSPSKSIFNIFAFSSFNHDWIRSKIMYLAISVILLFMNKVIIERSPYHS